MTSNDRNNLEIVERLYSEPILDTGSMTLSDIDELGRTRLFIGLRTQRLVAFVGAGLSVAFGRLDWGALVDGAKRKALDLLNDDERLKASSRTAGQESVMRMGNPGKASIKDVAETLRSIDPTKSAENKLIALELAGEIMADKTGDPMALHRFLAKHTSSSNSFEKGRHKRMRDALAACAAIVGRPRFKVCRRTLQEAKTARLIAHLCKSELKSSLTIGDEKIFFPDVVAKHLNNQSGNVPDFFRQDAMVLQLALLTIALIRHPSELNKRVAVERLMASLDKKQKRPSKSSVENEAEAVSLPNDPIDALVRIFDIRRILTTNYDQELERYLVRAGFDGSALMPETEAGGTEGRAHSNRTNDHLGSVARSAVLTEHTVADLIEFAAAAPDIAIDIFHLHGRVDLPRTIIATEGDYRRTYLRNDHRKRDFEEALEVAFSANPVLFIGLGMSEADLLRPLRQFVSDRPRDHDRPLIVLFPRSHSELSAETERVLECKIRYGVNTILYGGKELGRARDLIQDLRRRLHHRNWAQFDTSSLEPQEEHSDDLDFYRKSLNFLIALLPKAFAGEPPSDPVERALEDAARALLRTFIQAADRQITTAALCHEMQKLRRDEEANWKIWTQLPRARLATYPTEASQTFIRHGVRHRDSPKLIDSVITGQADKRFDNLTRALCTVPPEKNGRRRRIIVIASDPGFGRGRIFWRLSDKKQQRKLLAKGRRYHQAFAATTSFSWEFSSAMDFMIHFLADGNMEIGGSNRIERLKQALDTATGWDEGARRLLILSGIDALLDRDGSPFGGEYAEIFPVLLDVRYQSAPLDIVLIVKPQHSSFAFINRCLNGLAGDLWTASAEDGSGLRASLVLETLVEIDDLDGDDPTIESESGVVGLRLKSLTLPAWRALGRTGQAVMAKRLAPLTASVKPSRDQIAEAYHKILRLRSEVGESGFANSAATAALLACVESEDDGKRSRKYPLVWLDGLIAELSTRDPAQRRGCCLREVLKLYNTLGAPRERALRLAILRHLAVMGIPVESYVLEQCPEIKAILDELPPDENGLDVGSCLKWLVQKHLVFEIIGKRADQLKNPPRFALHRLVQAEILRKMSCPRPEGGETNFFQVSLYAAQPLDLPSLNEPTYRFLCNMIDALIEQAPGEINGKTLGDRERCHKGIENVARCLRAAFGIIRASMSVAVISRLAVDVTETPDDEPGLFQSYKYRLRALTRRQVANDLAFDALASMSPARTAGKVPDPPLCSLYTDELVWSYNERGVASLSQGHLYDAQPLFRLALQACDHTDPLAESATTARINLNLAIVYIERGRLERAQELLRQVRDHERRRRARTRGRESDTIVSILAKGYLGLISHLSGRLVEATARYDEAIAKLSIRDRSRGVAIFCRHLANLYATMGRIGLAKQAITRAITSAQAGRHQDILHMARVTAAKLEQADQPARALEWLENAQRYAEFMDMPNLKTEVLFARGELLLAQGENRLAGEMATQALAIASRYGMVLRRISTLVLLGKIAQRRGNRETATGIFRTAGMLAERAGYHLKVELAHQLKLPTIEIVSIDSAHLRSPPWREDQSETS